jgi:hypothetical protein
MGVKNFEEKVMAAFAKNDKRFDKMDERFDRMDKHFDKTTKYYDVRFAEFRVFQEAVMDSFADIHKEMDKRFNRLEEKLDHKTTLLELKTFKNREDINRLGKNTKTVFKDVHKSLSIVLEK